MLSPGDRSAVRIFLVPRWRTREDRCVCAPCSSGGVKRWAQNYKTGLADQQEVMGAPSDCSRWP